MASWLTQNTVEDKQLGLDIAQKLPDRITEGLLGATTGGRITADNVSHDEYVAAARKLRETDTLKYNEYINTLRRSSATGDPFSGGLYKLMRDKGLFDEGDFQSTAFSAAERGLGWLRGAGDIVAGGLDIAGLDSFAGKLREDISYIDKASNPALNQDFSRAGRTGSTIGTIGNVATEFGLAAATGGATLAGAKGAALVGSRIAPKLATRVSAATARQTARTPRLAKIGRYAARETGTEVGFLQQDIADAFGQQRLSGEFNFSPKLAAAFLVGEIGLLGPLGFGARLINRSMGRGAGKAVGDIMADLPSKAKKDLEVEWARLGEGGTPVDNLSFMKKLRQVADQYLSQEDRVLLARLENQAQIGADAAEQVAKARQAGAQGAKEGAEKGLTDIEQSRFDELNSKTQFDKLTKDEQTEFDTLLAKRRGEDYQKETLTADDQAVLDEIAPTKPKTEPKVKPKAKTEAELPPKQPPPAKKAVKDTAKAKKADTKPVVVKKPIKPEVKAKKVKAETTVKKIEEDGLPLTLQAVPVGKITPIKPGSDAAAQRAIIRERNQKLIDDEIVKSEKAIKDIDRELSAIARETGQQKLLAPPKSEVQPTTAKAKKAAKETPPTFGVSWWCGYVG